MNKILSFFVLTTGLLTFASCSTTNDLNSTVFTPEYISKENYEQRFEELTNIVFDDNKVYRLSITQSQSTYGYIQGNRSFYYENGNYADVDDLTAYMNVFYYTMENMLEKNFLDSIEDLDYNTLKISRTINSVINVAPNKYKIDYYYCVQGLNKSSQVLLTIDLSTTTYDLFSVSNGDNIRLSESDMTLNEFEYFYSKYSKKK